jgi:hypothetical protein
MDKNLSISFLRDTPCARLGLFYPNKSYNQNIIMAPSSANYKNSLKQDLLDKV